MTDHRLYRTSGHEKSPSKTGGRYKKSNTMKFAKVRKIDDKSFEKWGVPGAYVHTTGPLDPEDADLVRKVVEDMKKAAPKDGEEEKR